MFDIGWTELVLLGIIALIVIGPEDLPDMFRQIGRFTAKIRMMSREFSKAMDQAANESGVKDVAKDLKTMTSPKSLGLNAVKDAADKFEKWDPLKKTAAAAATTTGAAKNAEAAEAPAKAHGSATQELYDKQAAKRATTAETSAEPKAQATAKAATKTASKPAAKATAKATTAKAAAKPAARRASVPKPSATPKNAKKAKDA